MLHSHRAREPVSVFTGQPVREAVTMRPRTPIPPSLGSAFTIRQAAEAGVGRGRAASADLARPFHGVRSRNEPASPLDRVHALATRLRAGQLVGGASAVHLWGYPFPGYWSMSGDIEVVVPTGSPRVRVRGVRGLRLAAGRAAPWRVDGVPVVDPVAALFMCARHLTHLAVAILLDALVTRSDNYPGLRRDRPFFTVSDIEDRLREWGRFPGCARVRAMLPWVREGVDSPKETETRLLIVAGGLPEPEVQHEIRRDGGIVARSDLAYPTLRIAIEYEGDGHRTDRRQWRRDIQRQGELEALGWIVIRVTQLDLAEDGRQLCERVARAIASRRHLSAALKPGR